MKKIPDEILNCFHNNQRFLILLHQKPDGDAIGSAVALGKGLKQLNKTVDYYIRTYDQLFSLAQELLIDVEDIHEKKIRLLGLTLKNPDSLDDALPTNLPVQLSLDFKDV